VDRPVAAFLYVAFYAETDQIAGIGAGVVMPAV
jgi:hypothetical protein